MTTGGKPEWPGGAAAAVGASGSTTPAELDELLRAAAARAVRDRPAVIEGHPWRQRYHVEPPVGLLNDPNGLVQHDDIYQLCYQWHPFGQKHALKFWAWVTSTDLVHWSTPTIALSPSHPYESHGCYSGSALFHDGQVHALYTGNVRTPDGGRTPYQLLATLDQETGRYLKDPANPLIGTIPGYSQHVRDPKVWSQDGEFWMVLGAQTEDLHGTVLLFRSPDLRSWTLCGPIAGTAEDPYGYMWECPDLLYLDGRAVLLISPQFDHGLTAGPDRWQDVSGYAVGDLDTDAPQFLRDGPFRPIDLGPDFYAPQTFPAADGRTIMIGWMGMPDHEGQAPLETKHPTAPLGWVHCLTVPRVLSLDEGELVQWPVDELSLLRGRLTEQAVTLTAGAGPTLCAIAGSALDLELTVTGAPGAVLTLRLRDGTEGRPVLVSFDPNAGTVSLDRSKLGTGEGGISTGFVRRGPTVSARILLDHSSVEVFADGGRLAMSARIYPPSGQEAVSLEASGAVQVELRGWPLADAMARSS